MKRQLEQVRNWGAAMLLSLTLPMVADAASSTGVSPSFSLDLRLVNSSTGVSPSFSLDLRLVNSTLNCHVTTMPTSALADGSSAIKVTVTLVDGNGQPVSGKTIKVSALGTTMGVAITQPANPTDVNGQATATVTSTTPGTVLLAVTDVTDGIPLSAQFQQPTVTFTANLVAPNNDLRWWK